MATPSSRFTYPRQTCAGRRALCLAIAVAASWAPIARAEAASERAREILDSIDDMYRGKTSHGTLTMKVKTEHWTRELTVEFWGKGRDDSMMRILAPTKEKGTATLRVDKNIWNYLPKVKRVIKVPSSMMGGSWMGSHFTNDDLVRVSRMADDFTFEITFEGKRDGQDIVEITCIPKPDAAVVWGKIVVEVRPDKIPVRMRYYDEDLQLARTMTFSEIQTIGGRTLPTRSRIQPADKPDEYTEVAYGQIDFDVEIPDSVFSLRNLQH